MKCKITRGKSEKLGNISKIELPNGSRIYVSKKGWTLVDKDNKTFDIPFSEINLATQESLRNGYVHITQKQKVNKQ